MILISLYTFIYSKKYICKNRLASPSNVNSITLPAPIHSLQDHSLPITDIHVGVGGINARAFTSSLDTTCKVRDGD